MDRGLAARLGSFVILIVASCGSGHENSDSPANIDGGASAGDDATTGSGADGSAGSGSGSGSSGADGGAEGGVSGGTSAADVLQMHKHANRDGLFVDSAFTESAYKNKTLTIDASFDGTFGTASKDNAYASPLYIQDGVNGKGTFYVATEGNHVYALDETTGKSVITAGFAGNPASMSYPSCGCGNIRPIGITGTPAIDPSSRLIVFDAVTGDGTSSNGIKTHTIHAWSIDDFHEVWSFDVSTLKDPTVGSFVPQIENERSAVLILNGVAYVTYGGHYGDCGLRTSSVVSTPPKCDVLKASYHGWIVAIPLSATSATVASSVKYWVTPATEAGMWAPGGVSSDGKDVFAATGNGDNGSGWKGAYSVLRFNTTNGLSFTQSSTNYFHAVMDTQDTDLGGSGPLVVDDSTVTPPKMIVQFGKDGYAYVVDRTNLGGDASPKSMTNVSSDEISNVSAAATSPKGTYIAFVGNNGGAAMNCLSGSGDLGVVTIGADASMTVPWCADNQGGGSPSITSSDGSKDFMVWTVGTDIAGSSANSSHQVHSWDLITGTPMVTGSATIAKTRHFTTPIFVHGRVFVVGDNRLYALKL